METLMVTIAVAVAMGLAFVGVLTAVIRNLLYLCGPNEVLIFSGAMRRVSPHREVGYRLVKGGRGYRVPLIERVDTLDLTNMTINVEVKNAFSKGGIPLTIQGVANVKIAGDEPLIFAAIERFLGKERQELIKIIKDTLEGNLRGILARLTPEQVNEDKLAFAQSLVEEAEDDLKRMGIILDTLKIQNVTDEVGYLDAIGRKRSAELQMRSVIAEANAQAQSAIRSAENLQATQLRRLDMDADVARAEAERRIADAQTRKGALVAERRSKVAAQVARAQADIPVQEARREQTRLQLDADVVRPAVAQRAALESNARADASIITEGGKATVRALDEFVTAWLSNGSSARDVVMMEKLAALSRAISGTVSGTTVDRFTLLGSGDGQAGAGLSELVVDIASRLKAATGVDPVRRYLADGSAPEEAETPPRPEPAPRRERAPAPAQAATVSVPPASTVSSSAGSAKTMPTPPARPKR